MIIADNPQPSLVEFKELMKRIDIALNIDAMQHSAYYQKRTGLELEHDVMGAAIECAKNTKFEGSIHLISGHSFPDIVAAKIYGIEVKSSQSNNWTSIGNSILESTRVSDIERIFLTFGKLSSPVEFKSRPYEECLSGIAVTHYPRYQIDMSLAPGNTIFDKIGLSYDELRSMANPVEPVAKYYKSKLSRGESLWWAGTQSESVETVVPATVRLWRTLSAYEKDELEATIYSYFPETIVSSSQFKYDRATLWLATQKGIIYANVRDSFSSGGRNIMQTISGESIEMPAVFKKIQDHIELFVKIINDTPSVVLSENWGQPVDKNRIKQWINLVINEATDAEKRKKARGVLERIFENYLHI